MNVLGMSYMYHDSAATLLRDGVVVAAAAEERFIRVKHTVDFPVRALEYVLEEGGIGFDDLDAIVFYEKPYLKFERILTSHLMVWPKSWKSFRHFLPMWLNYKLRVPQIIREKTGYKGKILFTDHHYAHAASAFLPSPFEDAMIMTTDGTGEWSTLALGTGRGTKIQLDQDIRFPHSLGLLYSAVTAHLGFKVNGGEGKVMGLASYGKPRFRAQMDKVLQVRPDGSFQLDMSYFSFHYDLVMTNQRFADLFIPLRAPESEVRSEHEDLAASLQVAIEDCMIKLVNHAYAQYKIPRLCMAGGVALNCVANGRLVRETPIEEIWVQPAAGDDGGALGAALYAYTQLLGGKHRWKMEHAFLGPSYDHEACREALVAHDLAYEEYDEDGMVQRTADLLAQGRIIAWYQGRMEYGPRALGNRSILTDPRPPEMKDILNRRVKRREGFRPFAPAVAVEQMKDYFETEHDSPFMLLAVPVREDKKAVVPAITHVDGTARLQTVSEPSNPLFYKLIRAFEQRTGVPMLLNTSFNVRGEPIVCTPREAVSCFRTTDLDALILGRFVIVKQPEAA
jgi:carbamoyltransferase